MSKYILGIDQSTSGTKAVIADENAVIIGRSDCPHEQIISKDGWVSHNPEEIYESIITAVKNVIGNTGINSSKIEAVAISNQRETAMVWDKATGNSIDNAVVWQCGRAKEICKKIQDSSEMIKNRTGLPLSPYFSGAKIAWIMENNDTQGKSLCAGTMDSWILYKLTNGKVFKTDYSNASRTQLFNIYTLEWDKDICNVFGIDPGILPEVCDSNSDFGTTDINGILDRQIPIYAVIGDSHGALYGQGCIHEGMTKATYGTGSSVMMNVGNKPIKSGSGLVTSLAWGIDGKVSYVLEGNINYTGSVTKWLVEDVQLIGSSGEAGNIAKISNPEDTTYLVPAFTGLGAPYWKSDVKAMLYGMSRSTGKAEIVRAAEECIAYQIADIVNAMKKDLSLPMRELRVDGGPTRDSFLMQFQSDILGSDISVPESEELSVMGAAFIAGIKCGMYPENIYLKRKMYSPMMNEKDRQRKYSGWLSAIELLTKYSV